jgi:hypothetical protein
MVETNGCALMECLTTLEIGEPQMHGKIVILPLRGGKGGSIDYLTLREALSGSLIRVTEVDSGGSVPELKVVNGADLPVILLDGEELAGAKQNRVLNATILLKEKSDTVVPVSCTESGRWSYRSDVFSDSGHISPHTLRRSKLSSVNESLAANVGFRGDQGRVWADIEQFQAKANHRSPTNAMRDVLEAHEQSIGSYLEAFRPVEGQRGLIAVIEGEAVGFDLLSLPRAYASLHDKLVKSYVMDALLSQATKERPAADAPSLAKEILEEAAAIAGSRYKSVGHGWDNRYRGPSLVGSALVHEGTVIHAAFFRVAPEERDNGPGMASMRARRRNRTEA